MKARSCWILPMIFVLTGALSQCSKPVSQPGAEAKSNVNAAEREKIASEVTDAMNSYVNAIKALDIERVIGHYANEPEFRVFMDGKIFGYDAYVSQVRADLSQASGFEGGWQGMTAVILGPKVAAAAAPFREVIIDKAGQRTAIKGTVTWIWVLRGSRWKILYGHGTHELDSGPGLDAAAVERELRAMEAGHRAAIDAKNIESIRKYYSQDLITISPREPILYGNEWIRTAVADLYKAYEFHEDFKFIDIRPIGDRVEASYSFSQQMTPHAGGEKIEAAGKGMCILKRSDANLWQFEWNSYCYDEGGDKGAVSVAASLTVRQEVRRTLEGFFKAIEEREFEKFLSFFAPGDDLTVFEDKELNDWEGFVAYAEAFFKGVAELRFDIEKCTVDPIGPGVAVATGVFKGTGKATSGESLALRNAYTWVLMEQGDRWRIKHVHESSL